MKALFNLCCGVLIIAAFVYSIFSKEDIIKDGDTIYLALAPVDPRSIMQGDYMRLRYAAEGIAAKFSNKPDTKTGFLIMKINSNKTAIFSRFSDGKSLADDEINFKYTGNRFRINIEPSSFLFQQGLRPLYQVAKFGIFKVSGDEHLLVGLADGDLKEIKPPKP